MADQQLAERVQRLDDIEALTQWPALFCDICDDGRNPDRIVEISTADGTWNAMAHPAPPAPADWTRGSWMMHHLTSKVRILAPRAHGWSDAGRRVS